VADTHVQFFASSETHSAVIVLMGDRAYKIKKPVNLGFLDFTTLDQRRAVCHREVELNRRIAADVYLGVADMIGPDGRPCEHLVVMRRMSAQRRLSALVRDGGPLDREVRQIARRVAVFHSSASTGPQIAAEGTRDAICRRWTDSFQQLRALASPVLAAGVLDEVESLTYEFLDGREPLFSARVSDGRVVDGHGDLMADDIYCLEDGPRILDCIEFDDRLRWLDQLDDAAFLAMDLEYLGAGELATRYLDWYLEYSADPAPTALRHHFIAYRAFVRCKVACLRALQGDDASRDEAARHADLTLTHLRAGVITLTIVGGMPGTGKSTVSGALADRVGAVVISSDRTRKELANLSPSESAAAPYGEGIYRPEFTELTYDTMLGRAEELLERGERVVLDASWTDQEQREKARALAARTHSRLSQLECVAAAGTVVERLRRRAHSVSDADEQVAAAMAARADLWPESSVVDTGGDMAVSVQAAVAVWSRTASGG
jgi:aminoglycoside phosphotransferase family enzyme/predicted kinase